MKTFLRHLATVLVTMFLNGLLLSIHHNWLDSRFEECKTKLIKDNNYQSINQAMICAKKSIGLRLLATLIHQEGTLLDGSLE